MRCSWQTLERVEKLSAPPRPVTGEPEPLEAVRHAIAEVIRRKGDTGAASDLNDALRALARHPTQAAFELVREVAEDERVGRTRDARGHSCRAVALSTWLELGYPWALELSPEALDEVRTLHPPGSLGWLRATAVFAAISALFNGTITLGAAEMLGANPVLVPFGFMLLHAVAAFVVAVVHRRRAPKKARWLRLAGRVGVLGPLAVVFAWFWEPDAALAASLLFAPFALTAFAASVASGRVEAEELAVLGSR